MKNSVKPGKCITYVNISGADIPSGKLIVCGNHVFCTTGVIKNTESGEVLTEEVIRYGKTTGQAWVVGTTLYYDPATDKLTSVAGSLKVAGFAAEVAASGDLIGECKLWPMI